MFKTILIAQRGECAARVARTCRHLEIKAVGLAQSADEQGVHIDGCDEIVVVEPSAGGVYGPADIVGAAKECAADGVFVGYANGGRNSELRAALDEAGIAAIGTSVAAGSLTTRKEFRELVTRSSGRVPPAKWQAEPELEQIVHDAETLGYPVELRGARRSSARIQVQDEDELHERWRRTKPLFSEGLWVEKSIERAREVAVLVAADQHGAVSVLCDVDRSLGAGHLIEESPSPELIFAPDGEAIRGALFEGARLLALESKCTGLMMVHFRLDTARRAWFDDISIGLPRQHAMMEMVAGLDLVALALKIAAGEKLDASLEVLQPTGHAMAASVCLEGEAAAHPIEELSPPPSSQDRVRFERCATVGRTIAADDGTLLMKVTVRTALRHRTLLTLDRTLAETRVLPEATNLPQLRQVLGNFCFRAGRYDRGFEERYLA